MAGDELFRWLVIAGLVLVLPIGIYHRLAARTGERLDRWQEGWWILFPLRILGLAGIASVMVFAIYPPWIVWASLPLPDWVRWIGVALGILTAGLLWWTLRHLGTNLTDTVVTR